MKRLIVVLMAVAVVLMMVLPNFGGVRAQEDVKIMLSDSGVTIVGNIDFFQVVIGRVPYLSHRFSPILQNGEWWISDITEKDTLWYKVSDGLRWFPTIDGKGLYGPVLVDTLALSSVKNDILFPCYFILNQNYPNPFNPTTIISFQLSEIDHVTLKIYNTRGQEIAKLVDGLLDGGEHSITWNAGDMPSGVYLYRLTTEKFSQSGRMILMK